MTTPPSPLTARRLQVCIVGAVLTALLVSVGRPAMGRGVDSTSASVLGVESPPSVRMLERARTLMLDARFSAASESLRVLARRPDGRVAAYHGLSTIALYQFLFTEADAYADRFASWADSLGAALDDGSDVRASDPGIRLARAESALMRAMVAGREGRYLAAAWQARSAFRRFERLHDDHPTFADAQFGFGLLHLSIGVLPRSYQRFLSVLGFDGDAVRGRRELAYAAREGRVNRAHAAMTLALVDLVLTEDVDAGRERLAALHETRPTSVLYAYLHGFALLTDRQADAAATVLQNAADRAASTDAFFIDFLDALLGQARFVTEAYATAERHFRRYLGRHRGQALQATTYLHLGLAIEMQGRWDDAVPYYRLVTTARDFASDRAAQRWAQARVERPMPPVERRLLRGRNASDAGRHDVAERVLRPLYADSSAADEHRTEAAYFLARTAHDRGRSDEALRLYGFVIANPADDEAKFAPYSHLYSGNVYAARGDTARAVAAYEAALDWPTPYDYDESVEQTARLRLLRMRGEW